MISVVVPAYNEEKTISKCLGALSKQECELIIVVGGSDNTDKIAKKFGKVIKDTKCGGAGPARNLGVGAAKSKIILFTDGDTIVPENWVEQYKTVFGDEKIVACGGIVRPLAGTIVDKIVYKINQDWLYRFTALFGFYQLSGNNCGYRKKDFLKQGGFDEEMTMLEDTELPMRVEGKIVTDKNIIVWTSPRRMKTRGYMKTWFQFMRAYMNWFIFGVKPTGRYFASAEKGKT